MEHNLTLPSSCRRHQRLGMTFLHTPKVKSRSTQPQEPPNLQPLPKPVAVAVAGLKRCVLGSSGGE